MQKHVIFTFYVLRFTFYVSRITHQSSTLERTLVLGGHRRWGVVARLVAHGFGGGDPPFDRRGLGRAALQVALDSLPVRATDDLAIAREEALLGLGRVARWRRCSAVALGRCGLLHGGRRFGLGGGGCVGALGLRFGLRLRALTLPLA